LEKKGGGGKKVNLIAQPRKGGKKRGFGMDFRAARFYICIKRKGGKKRGGGGQLSQEKGKYEGNRS